MLEVNEQTKFKLNEGFVLHQVEELGKYWLFNIKTGDVFNLNEVSSYILQKLSNSVSVTSLVLDIMQNFEAEEEVIRQDVKETLEQLLNDGIISQDEGEG